MTVTRLLWGGLAGLGIGLTTLSVVHGNLASLVFPLSLGATFLLLRRSGRRTRFPPAPTSSAGSSDFSRSCFPSALRPRSQRPESRAGAAATPGGAPARRPPLGRGASS